MPEPTPIEPDELELLALIAEGELRQSRRPPYAISHNGTTVRHLSTALTQRLRARGLASPRAAEVPRRGSAGGCGITWTLWTTTALGEEVLDARTM